MKNLYTALITIGIIITGSTIYASPTVINFNDLETPTGWVYEIPSYTNSGYQFTTNSGGFAYWAQDCVAYNSSAALLNYYNNGVTRLSAVNGANFSLISMDLDTYRKDNGPSPILFNAYDSFGTLLGSNSTTLTTDGWRTFSFSSLFSNVAYVEWAQIYNYHQFDNVVINGSVGTPLPSTVFILLFGGLTGLVSRLRKKSN